MGKEKVICWGLNCKEEIEAQTCCSDYDGSCGCRGLPIDPPFCSSECYEKYMSIKREDDGAITPLTPLDL